MGRNWVCFARTVRPASRASGPRLGAAPPAFTTCTLSPVAPAQPSRRPVFRPELGSFCTFDLRPESLDRPRPRRRAVGSSFACQRAADGSAQRSNLTAAAPARRRRNRPYQLGDAGCHGLVFKAVPSVRRHGLPGGRDYVMASSVEVRSMECTSGWHRSVPRPVSSHDQHRSEYRPVPPAGPSSFAGCGVPRVSTLTLALLPAQQG